MNFRLSLLLVALLAAGGCDRRVEPFVPGEKAQTPDLAKIFPAGAERAARPAAGMPAPAGRAPAGRGAAPVVESVAPIEGTVELAPELAGMVPPNAVVFLMARREEGGPLIAAQRIDTQRFPVAFSLGSEHRMGSAAQFAGPLQISVRVDADGNATTRNAGDLLGSAAKRHEPGDRGVVVLISEVQTTESEPGTLSAAATEAVPAAVEKKPAVRASPAAATTASNPAAIEGTLELAPGLAGRVSPGSVLFVIARTAPTGPPLAVVRVESLSFPAPFSIGPDDRMIQAMPFAGDIRITARVDADGNAMTRSPGDLQGATEVPNAPGDRDVRLVIDEML